MMGLQEKEQKKNFDLSLFQCNLAIIWHDALNSCYDGTLEACTSYPFFSVELQTLIYLCSKRKSYSHRQKQAAIARNMRLRRLDSRANPQQTKRI